MVNDNAPDPIVSFFSLFPCYSKPLCFFLSSYLFKPCCFIGKRGPQQLIFLLELMLFKIQIHKANDTDNKKEQWGEVRGGMKRSLPATDG
jgi:hypothetical protein